MRQGNVFTSVCHFVHRGMSGRTPPGRHPRADTLPPADGYCSGRYASYWNAFLFLLSLLSANVVHKIICPHYECAVRTMIWSCVQFCFTQWDQKGENDYLVKASEDNLILCGMTRGHRGKANETRLHSSRMHTARSLTVSPSMLCSGGGVPAPGGGIPACTEADCEQNHRRLWKYYVAPTSLRAVKILLVLADTEHEYNVLTFLRLKPGRFRFSIRSV